VQRGPQASGRNGLHFLTRVARVTPNCTEAIFALNLPTFLFNLRPEDTRIMRLKRLSPAALVCILGACAVADAQEWGSAVTAHEDQWLTATSCEAPAHALVNEAITAAQQLEYGRAWGLTQAALMLDDSCPAARLVQARLSNSEANGGSRAERIAELEGVDLAPSEAAYLGHLQAEDWRGFCASAREELPDDAFFMACATTPDAAGVENLIAFTERFPALASPAHNQLAYVYGQGLWGVAVDHDASRDHVEALMSMYGGPNAFDSQAELAAGRGEWDLALSSQTTAVDRGGAVAYGNNWTRYQSHVNEASIREAIEAATTRMIEAVGNSDEMMAAIQSSMAENVVMCFSSMEACGAVTAAEYHARTAAVEWVVGAGAARDIEVHFSADRHHAISTHVQTGAYMANGARVDYSTRVSGVWDLTGDAPRLIHANYAPMGGAGIPQG
jgi:hypothetical protein